MIYLKTFENFTSKYNLILYHGSNILFKKFNSKFLGTSMGKTPSNMSGFFFSDDIKVAESFGQYVYTCEVKINNPYIIDAKGKNYSQFKFKLNDIADSIDKYIYDSIIIKNYVDSFHEHPIISTQYVIFNNKNIYIKNIDIIKKGS